MCAQRQWQAHRRNTDGKGFLESLRSVIDPAGKKIVLLGAGGAARAIAVELALAQVGQLTIVNRNLAKAEELAALLRDKTHVSAAANRLAGRLRNSRRCRSRDQCDEHRLFDDKVRVPVKKETFRQG